MSDQDRRNPEKRRERRLPKEKEEEIVRLEDLAPPEDVKGGSGRILFGEDVLAREPPEGER
jgi:hypothetical protein